MKEAIVVAEYRLLNALVQNKEFRNDSRVHEDLFLHETAKSIFQAIEKLNKNNINISQASLLQASAELDYNINKGIIESVFDVKQEDINSLDDILYRLTESKKKQIIRKKLRELSSLSEEEGDLNYDKLMGGIYDIDSTLKKSNNNSILKSYSQWSDEYIEELKRRSKGKHYTFGDPILDKAIRKGAYPGAITTIAGATGQGKSTYVRNLISGLIDLTAPSIYISLEMSGIDTYDSLLSCRRSILLEDLYSYGSDAISLIDVVEQEKEEQKNNRNFYFIEEPNLSFPKLRSIIKEFKQRTGSDYLIVAIDLVTQMREFSGGGNNKSVANSYEEAMNLQNIIAKEENVHFINVVQFGRNADSLKIASIEDLERLRPSLNDIKNSQAIAERSRVVLSVFRKKYYADRYLIGVEGADAIPDIMELQVLKNSSGRAGDIYKYYFEGDFFRVTPMLEESKDELMDIDY